MAVVYRKTKINKYDIYHSLNGTRQYADGFEWIYA
jgi:hypothetical protein